jgi:purine nucleosidase
VDSSSYVSILDTDIGTDVDDILALTLMARSPEINLIGVTTVYGDTRLRAKMARFVCEQLDRRDVVIAHGESDTLGGQKVWWGGHEGEGIPGLDQVTIDGSRGGVEFLLDSAREHRGKLDLFTIGPLTNIGLAIQTDPSFASSIHHLYLMGGAYWSEQPEHNIKSDPEASDIVFRSGIPMTAVGLDVTTQVLLRQDGMDAISAKLGDLGDVLSQQFRRWIDFMAEHGIASRDNDATNPHDPMAVLAAIRPDLFGFEHCDVEIDLEGDTIGRTRLMSCESGRVKVAREIDAAAAEREMIRMITTPMSSGAADRAAGETSLG